MAIIFSGPGPQVGVRVNMFKVVIFTIFLLFSLSSWASFEVEITEQQMQQVAEQQFPIRKQTLLANITLSQPKLTLVDQRLELQSTIRADFANQTYSQGSAKISGKLGYRAKQGEFLLIQPSLLTLDIQGVDQQGDQLLQQLVSELIIQQLQSIVVYRLDEKRFKDRLTKQNLKSVTIRDGALFAEMEW